MLKIKCTIPTFVANHTTNLSGNLYAHPACRIHYMVSYIYGICPDLKNLVNFRKSVGQKLQLQVRRRTNSMSVFFSIMTYKYSGFMTMITGIYVFYINDNCRI